jgi:hypothetical protein
VIVFAAAPAHHDFVGGSRPRAGVELVKDAEVGFASESRLPGRAGGRKLRGDQEDDSRQAVTSLLPRLFADGRATSLS